ncbi:MAG TPA: proline dehydrogenase family protein [Candidatus Limnocylindrales bacterium]|nr:proline dehydrogenase family protein [Candidatus Limnocylindrales bacterium]
MRVELLVTPSCPHADESEANVRQALTVDGREPSVQRIYVGDLDHAAGLGFHGSPTLRIDGRDVVPPAPDSPIGLACRLYPQPQGTLGGAIPIETIREDLARREQDAIRARAARLKPRELPARASRAFFVGISRQPWLGRLATGFPLTRLMVRRFVAGEDLYDALAALERLQRRGLRWTVDVLGESVSSRETATAAADRYLTTLDALAERGLEANVSLKLTQMGLDLDVAFCRDNVARIVDRAAQLGAFVRVDMEDHTKTEVTLDIVRSLHERYHDVGAVIQSYLHRSAEDVERLIAEQVRVRLCKGAYDEPPEVAFVQRAEVDESFARLAERLLLDGRYPAMATHDERLIEHVIDFAASNGIGPDRFEFQMLHGVRRDLQESLVERGFTVRVYVPYGAEWYPYFMRRLGERPANVLFMLRSVLNEVRRR